MKTSLKDEINPETTNMQEDIQYICMFYEKSNRKQACSRSISTSNANAFKKGNFYRC
jgi:hypothetical protein